MDHASYNYVMSCFAIMVVGINQSHSVVMSPCGLFSYPVLCFVSFCNVYAKHLVRQTALLR